MSEWHDSRKIQIVDLPKSLRERIDKRSPRRELTAEEAKRLAKLEAIADKLRRVENVQNRQLKTWLTEDECAQIEVFEKGHFRFGHINCL